MFLTRTEHWKVGDAQHLRPKGNKLDRSDSCSDATGDTAGRAGRDRRHEAPAVDLSRFGS